MNAAITSSRQMKLMASVTALAATLVITGATLALADRYARTAADAQLATAGNPAGQHASPAAVVAFAG